jgi:transcriptional regulator with XRE-family HTH domain
MAGIRKKSRRKKPREIARNRRLGALVRSLRRERDLTLEELASRVGLSRQAIWQIESGSVTARRPTLESIARALGVTLASLLGGL